MKTFADKNKIETELRCTPSNIWRGKNVRKIAKRITVWVVCIVVGWFVAGIANEIITDPSVKINHIITAILVLWWFCVKGASTVKTIIAITIINVIF